MKLEGGPSENRDEWLSRASLLLCPLSITPVHGPYTTQCLKHRPLGASRLQIHIVMYPSFHTFFIFCTPAFPTWGYLGTPIHPLERIVLAPKGSSCPKPLAEESRGCQACRIPGGAAGGAVLLGAPGACGTELPCKCPCLHNFLALKGQ